MVFQKRAAKGAKTNQKTPLKSAKMQEADILVDSDDSNDSADVVKTPSSKTPKGKQPGSERKVSFQVQGTPAKNTPSKNSPAKGTPAKGTPGKGGLQQFAGMKKKQGVEEEDDDDDDEDDSDFDLGDDIDMAFNEDDDDSLDDDDDEDDDDDDDDDEEEKVQKPAKNKKGAKQQPPKAPQSPKKTPKNAKKEKGISKELASALETERKVTDAVKLYVGNLPNDVTIEELKGLSTDIVMVYLPTRAKKGKSKFGFLQFATEAKAEENLKKLKASKFRGQPFNVDFVGGKSSNKSSKAPRFNTMKLFITGLPLDCTVHQVSKFFPKAFQFTLNCSSSYRTLFVNFWTEEDCTEAIKSHPTIEVGGLKCSVLHAVASAAVVKKKSKKRSKKSKQNGLNPAKKMKLATPKKADSMDDDDEE